MNYKTTTTGAIRKEIKGINDVRTKLVDRIQATALACVYHAHVHGDVTLAIELAKAVGAGMKHEALKVWFSKFGPMSSDAEAVLKYVKSKRVDEAELDALMETAAGEAWHAAPTEKKAEDFEFGALLAQMLRKIDKAEGFTPDDAQAEVIEYLREKAVKFPMAPKKKTAKA